MPRVRKNPDDELKKVISTNINYEADKMGLDKETKEITFHLRDGTLNNKMKDPGKFKVDELMRFSKKVNVPIGELFYPKVSSRDAEEAMLNAEKACANAEKYTEQFAKQFSEVFAKQFSEEFAKQITYQLNTLINTMVNTLISKVTSDE